jgi:RHS repeat-associated protein
MANRLLAQAGLLTVTWLAAGVARADKPAPLSSQTLKAPSGPASLKGLGESFSANPATGTGSYSVGIALPPGFVVPSVSLTYSGGSGKGEVGVGFQLPTLQVYRMTDKGAPKFDETDRFAVSGPGYNDELVPADRATGVYRLKNEGPLVLFRRDAANDRWLVFQSNGGQSVLGGSAASRSVVAGRTARWYVESTRDMFGHQCGYRYSVDQGKVYWQGADYQQEADAPYRNRVELGYEPRPDVIRDYRYGDLEQTRLRLKTIEVWQGTRLLRRYSLGYEASSLWSLLKEVRMEGENGLAMPPLTFGYLPPSPRSGRFVKTEGYRTLTGLDTGRMTLEDVNGDGLPDLLEGNASDYAYYENIDGTRFSDTAVRLGSAGSPDRSLDSPGVVMADVDGDGYRDVWYPTGDGKFRYFTGGRIDRGRFLGYTAGPLMNGNAVVSDVTRPEIRLTDLNGDGRTDLLYQRAGLSDVWVENQLGRDLVQRSMPQLPSGVVLSSGSLELLDFNGDGILDLVLKEFEGGKHDLKIWYGLGSGRYWPGAQDWGAPAAAPREVFLTDVNRDGQTDLVRVSGSWVGYYLNDGRGSFAVQHGDFHGMPETSRTKRVFLADMNGNGTTDVVWLTVDGELDYLDLMGEPNVGLLSRIDNGMGFVTDISYRSSTDYAVQAKLRSERWKTPLPHPVPVIAEVAAHDSLERLGVAGWQSRTTYDYADGYYDGKEREFRGFARVTVSEIGDAYQEGKVTEMRMHVGRNLDTGADEESLKGKVWLTIEKTEQGEILHSEEARWEQRWLCQEDLGAGAAVVLPSCAGVTDRTAHKDDLVALAVGTDVLSGNWERQPNGRYTAKRTFYNQWGSPTRVESYGEVTIPAGHQLGQTWSFSDLADVAGDEAVEESDYANHVDLGTGTWLIGYPTEQRVKTLSGTVASKVQTYYDGVALFGLPLGQVDRGLVSRRLSWLAEESRWVPASRTEYNDDGLPITQVDPTAYTTTVVYDQPTRFFVTEERMPLEGGRMAVFSGTYDRGYGTPTSLTDANGKTVQYRYDGLGRLLKVIDPLGSEQEPLVAYSYSYGTTERPISTTTTRQLSDRGSGIYRTHITYSDGLGRPRLSKTQAEQGFVGSDWHVLSSRGAVARASLPFPSVTDAFEAAPPGTAEWLHYSDAVARPLKDYLPVTPEQGVSFVSHKYQPFESFAYDEKDATEGTYSHPEITQVDGLGRVRQVERTNLVGAQAIKLQWTFGYDVRGQLTSLKDPRQFERSYGYDSLGRLRVLADPNLGTIQYGYDDTGRLLLRTDGLGQELVTEYGASGRPARGVLRTRDAQGNVSTHSEFIFHYDSAQPDGPLPSAANLVGRLAWVEYPVGAEHYSYDERGLVTSEAVALWDGLSPFSAQTRTTSVRSSGYNAAGQETTRQLPGGFNLEIGYDARGLIRRLSAGLPQESRDILQQAVYDERGQPVRVDQGNGLRLCRSYNAREQIAGVILGKPSDLSCAAGELDRSSFGLYHLAYAWGFNGALNTIADRSPNLETVGRRDASYGYDAINQLTVATTAQGQWQYSYDTIQNLTGVRHQQGTAPWAELLLTYGEGAGPSAVTHAGGTALDYDVAGQLKQYNGYDLEFDEAGQLVQASKSGGKGLQYFYNPFGQRRLLLVTQPGGHRDVYRYPVDGYEERADDSVWRTDAPGFQAEVRQARGLPVDAMLLDELTAYVNAPQGKPKPLPQEWLDLDGDGDGFDAGDLAVARQAFWDGTLAGSSRLEWRFLEHDHLSSSAVLTDRVGDMVSTREYEPYGATAQRSGVQPVIGFTGAEVEPDEDLGLIRMGSRYYAPALKRWITPDRYIGESPANMGQHLLDGNLYSYSRNNPVLFTDRSGAKPTHHAAANPPAVVRHIDLDTGKEWVEGPVRQGKTELAHPVQSITITTSGGSAIVTREAKWVDSVTHRVAYSAKSVQPLTTGDKGEVFHFGVLDGVSAGVGKLGAGAEGGLGFVDVGATGQTGLYAWGKAEPKTPWLGDAVEVAKDPDKLAFKFKLTLKGGIQGGYYKDLHSMLVADRLNISLGGMLSISYDSHFKPVGITVGCCSAGASLEIKPGSSGSSLIRYAEPMPDTVGPPEPDVPVKVETDGWLGPPKKK